MRFLTRAGGLGSTGQLDVGVFALRRMDRRLIGLRMTLYWAETSSVLVWTKFFYLCRAPVIVVKTVEYWKRNDLSFSLYSRVE
jgi:hypothetical protein